MSLLQINMSHDLVRMLFSVVSGSTYVTPVNKDVLYSVVSGSMHVGPVNKDVT